MKIKFLVILAFIPLCFYGQSVSPLNTNEYCPSTNVAFTFTAPGSYSSASVSVVFWGGSIISYSHSNASGVSVVTATIRFAEANTTQAIRFNYGSTD